MGKLRYCSLCMLLYRVRGIKGCRKEVFPRSHGSFGQSIAQGVRAALGGECTSRSLLKFLSLLLSPHTGVIFSISGAWHIHFLVVTSLKAYIKIVETSLTFGSFTCRFPRNVRQLIFLHSIFCLPTLSELAIPLSFSFQ